MTENEQCGFPIGSGGKRCVLSKNHSPSTACWYKKGEEVERDCPEPECKEKFILVQEDPLLSTMPFAPKIPNHWEQLPAASNHAPPRRGQLCPGSGQ